MNEQSQVRDLPPGTKVWLYLRHSPGDDQTLESQEEALREHCRRNSWSITEVFRDRAKSGRSTSGREEFNRMVYLAKQDPRPADVILIWDLSRFGRDIDQSQFYKLELRMRGWHVVSLNDDIPEGPVGTIIEAVIAWKNQQFLDDLRAATIRGLRYIADQGCLPVGQPCVGYKAEMVPLGSAFRNGEQRMGRRPFPDPGAAPLVVRAFEMKARGAPNKAIAEETKLFVTSSGSWNHLFRNKAYIGEYNFGGEVFPNVYPALVSRELFSETQDRLPRLRPQMRKRDHPRRKGSTFFLANLSVCGHCGAPMEGKRVHRYRYYVCSRRNEDAGLCSDSRLVPADDVEQRTVRFLLDHLLRPEYLAQLLAWTNEQLGGALNELRLLLASKTAELELAEHAARSMANRFLLLQEPAPIAARIVEEKEAEVGLLRKEVEDIGRQLASSQIQMTREQIEQFALQETALLGRGELFDLSELCARLLERIVMTPEECRLEVSFPCQPNRRAMNDAVRSSRAASGRNASTCEPRHVAGH
jgi:DNA invertase Pin-like site-specific DNA recombinase